MQSCAESEDPESSDADGLGLLSEHRFVSDDSSASDEAGADQPIGPDMSDAGSVPGLIDVSADDDDSDNISLVSSESWSDSEGDVDWALINRTCAAHDVIRVDSSDSDDEPMTKKQRCVRAPATSGIRKENLQSTRLRDDTVPEIGLTSEEMGCFLSFGIPRTLLFILAIMHRQVEYANGTIVDCIEYFSGEAAVTRALLAKGLRAMEFDVKNCPRYQDLNGNWGFVAALQHLRQLTPRQGFIWLGTVCSSWVFMSRNSSMRTDSDPRGDLGRRFVQRGNRQAARSALIIAWCYSRLCGFVLEQPGSSIIWRHPAMLHVQKCALAMGGRWHLTSTYMFHFSAKHVKRTELCSNESWIHNLSRRHPGRVDDIVCTATTRVRSDGKKQCSGTAALKQTQTYTAAFGAALAESVMEVRGFFDDVQCNRGQLAHVTEDLDADPWEDCELEGVLAVLQDKHGTGRPNVESDDP